MYFHSRVVELFCASKHHWAAFIGIKGNPPPTPCPEIKHPWIDHIPDSFFIYVPTPDVDNASSLLEFTGVLRLDQSRAKVTKPNPSQLTLQQTWEKAYNMHDYVFFKLIYIYSDLKLRVIAQKDTPVSTYSYEYPHTSCPLDLLNNWYPCLKSAALTCMSRKCALLCRS